MEEKDYETEIIGVWLLFTTSSSTDDVWLFTQIQEDILGADVLLEEKFVVGDFAVVSNVLDNKAGILLKVVILP